MFYFEDHKGRTLAGSLSELKPMLNRLPSSFLMDLGLARRFEEDLSADKGNHKFKMPLRLRAKDFTWVRKAPLQIIQPKTPAVLEHIVDYGYGSFQSIFQEELEGNIYLDSGLINSMLVGQFYQNWLHTFDEKWLKAVVNGFTAKDSDSKYKYSGLWHTGSTNSDGTLKIDTSKFLIGDFPTPPSSQTNNAFIAYQGRVIAWLNKIRDNILPFTEIFDMYDTPSKDNLVALCSPKFFDYIQRAFFTVGTKVDYLTRSGQSFTINGVEFVVVRRLGQKTISPVFEEDSGEAEELDLTKIHFILVLRHEQAGAVAVQSIFKDVKMWRALWGPTGGYITGIKSLYGISLWDVFFYGLPTRWVVKKARSAGTTDYSGFVKRDVGDVYYGYWSESSLIAGTKKIDGSTASSGSKPVHTDNTAVGADDDGTYQQEFCPVSVLELAQTFELNCQNYL